MGTLLITGIVMIIIGGIRFKIERRSFLTGVILIAGILSLIIYIVGIVSEYGDISRVLVLGVTYVVIPILIVLTAIFLIKNGKVMMTKEGRKLANLLSLIIGLDIFLIIFLMYILIKYGYKLNLYVYMGILFIIIMSVYLGFLFMAYLLYSYVYQKLPVKKDVDYVIVLGSGLIGDKVPPLLKSRLDKGIEIYKKQLEKGYKCKIIVSGGQGSDELVSEACAMGRYLISQGIKESDVILEDKSTTTYENMSFSKKIMDKSPKYNCVFVTNNYHVFRASIFARKVGLKADGVGAPTAFYFLPSALIREYIAILVIYKWYTVVFVVLLLGMIVFSLSGLNL